MEFCQRCLTASNLAAHSELRIGKDIAYNKGGLVYIETTDELIHPFLGTPLENPMTWDTFTHLYLLGK